MAKTFSNKKPSSKEKNEEVIKEEVKVTEKITKSNEDKPEEKAENVVKETSDSNESSPENETKEDEPEVAQEKEDTQDEQSEVKDTKSSTVYADDFSAVTVEKRFSMGRLLLFILIVVVSAGVFFTGMILYQSNRENFTMANVPFLTEPTPTPTVVLSPTPSPTPELVFSDYSVQVLNGSGISGVAGSVATLLENEGFEGVDVGNAEDQDYEETEIQMKEDVPSEMFDELAKILSTYTLIEGAELEDDGEYDIVIVVGQETESSDDNEE